MLLLLYYYLYSDLPISMRNNLQINLWRHLVTLLTYFNYFPLKKTILCKRSAVDTHKDTHLQVTNRPQNIKN